MKYYSPLRYPGGKNKAVSLFKDIIDANGLRNCVYVEPFAGGASVALALLFEGYASRIIINDADPSIYAFWYTCLYRVDELCQKMNEIEITIAQWQAQKEIYKEQRARALAGEDYDLMQLGFATFFLNRTNRSGILKGGIIGGYSQNGKYLIDARFNRNELEERLRRVASYSDKIELHSEDAKSFLEKYSEEWPDNTFVYCDPPYVVRGRDLYMNYFKQQDHRDLAKVIIGINKKVWVTTYDVNDLILNIYKEKRIHKLVISYSAGSHTSNSEELIIFSDCAIIPKNEKIL